jgi:hypothetical protein
VLFNDADSTADITRLLSVVTINMSASKYWKETTVAYFKALQHSSQENLIRTPEAYNDRRAFWY